MGTKGVFLSLALFMCTWRCFAESTMAPESDLIYENSNNQLQDRNADKWKVVVAGKICSNYTYDNLDDGSNGQIKCQLKCVNTFGCVGIIYSTNATLARYCGICSTTSLIDGSLQFEFYSNVDQKRPCSFGYGKAQGSTVEDVYTGEMDTEESCASSALNKVSEFKQVSGVWVANGNNIATGAIWDETDKNCWATFGDDIGYSTYYKSCFFGAPGCPNDLWSKYVTKQLPITVDLSSTWRKFYKPQDLSALGAEIQVGKPYTIGYNVTSTCSKDVVIGFAGSGGFFKGNVPANSKNKLVMISDNWMNSATRLENRGSCHRRKITIHNIHLFEGDGVNIKCVQ